jgi:hypothetical protein
LLYIVVIETNQKKKLLVKDWSMKRGRGRPRKDSFSNNPNFNNNLLNNSHYPNFDEGKIFFNISLFFFIYLGLCSFFVWPIQVHLLILVFFIVSMVFFFARSNFEGYRLGFLLLYWKFGEVLVDFWLAFLVNCMESFYFFIFILYILLCNEFFTLTHINLLFFFNGKLVLSV